MSKQTKMSILEGGRAEFAYKCVEEAKNPHPKFKYKQSDYKSYIKKIPVLIQTNGLGNTLAFMYSKRGEKKKNAYDQIYENLSDWLKKPEYGCELLPQEKDLLKGALSQDSVEYRQVTTECLALLNWLRRLAEGMLEGGEESE